MQMRLRFWRRLPVRSMSPGFFCGAAFKEKKQSMSGKETGGRYFSGTDYPYVAAHRAEPENGGQRRI